MDKSTIYTHDVGKVLPMQLRYWPRWSLGHRTANLILASGQPGVDNKGNVVAPGDAGRQSHDALENVRRIVEGGGGVFADVFKIRVFLNFAEDYDAIVRSVGEYLGRQFPEGDLPAISYAVSPVGATRDRSMLLVEIEGFAATDREVARSEKLFPGFSERYRVADYAHATRVGNLVFSSGFLGIDASGRLVSDQAEEQAAQAFANVGAALDAAGVQSSDIVKLTMYVDTPDTFDRVREARASFLGDVQAAATSVVVPVGIEGARLLVEAVAAEGPKEVIATDEAYRAPGCAQAVMIPLTSHAGSYLRRFTWPTHPPDADRRAIGLELERERSLGHLVFLSSQLPLDREGKVVGGGDAGTQTSQVFENMRVVVEAAGGKFDDILQADIYVASADNYAAFNEARVRFSEEHYPDKSWFCGSGVTGRPLVENAHVEIESIAAVA